MKKNLKMRIGVIAVSIFALCVVGFAATPGTEDDPLISKAYVDDVLMPKIEQYVESRIAEVKTNSNDENTDASKGADAFKVVEVKAGEEIICSAGAELILRMGKATIIATEKGGLADTTIGYDLADGVSMPANHLLIVPVADGRGILAETDVIVMIKGGYTVQ